jgi:hypothetical protein
MMPLLCFLLSRLGQRTGIYYIDSTYWRCAIIAASVGTKPSPGLAVQGKTSKV